MSFSDRFILFFRRVLPSPFTIAVLLSIVTYFLALFTTRGDKGIVDYGIELMTFWESSLWTGNLLVFSVQMMLILVLGHVLAISPIVERFIYRVSSYATNTAKAAFLVSFFTILVAYFNWGLGLIFGAIFARKVGESAVLNKRHLNYPLIGAAGYSGLMVWHGGISGSATTKVAEVGHLAQLVQQSNNNGLLASLPSRIGFEETVFSPMNLFVFVLSMIVIPLALYFIGKRVEPLPVELKLNSAKEETKKELLTGAEKLDHSKVLAYFFGAVILGATLLKMTFLNQGSFFDFFNPNNINFLLLGLGIVFHGSFKQFISAVDEAISGISGILIQFPLYFGIMGIMNQSGLIADFSSWLVSLSNTFTFPILTFFSAGIVNLFVPSGGGQWAIQGPILVEASQQLGASLPKAIMAMCYGDQLTNMLQPFWALPLLGITQLKAREILPFTLLLFIIGLSIFLLALILF